MSFFEGGRKTINQTSIVTNQQAAVQGSGNFTVTGGLSVLPGGSVNVQSLDPLALQGMENVAKAATEASERYVEFASESNRLGLETVGDVAKTYAGVAERVAGLGMTPEQITADKGTQADKSAQWAIPVLTLAGLAVAIYLATKRT